MGLFDSIQDYDLLCVYCGARVIETQTKNIGDPTMTTYKPHLLKQCLCQSFLWQKDRDKHATGLDHLRYVEATAICRSPACSAYKNSVDLLERGYTGGAGRMFSVHYPVVDGIMTGPAEIAKEYDADGDGDKPFAQVITDALLKIESDTEMFAAFMPLLDKVKFGVLALSMFRYD